MIQKSSRVLPTWLIFTIVGIVMVSPIATYLALRRPQPPVTPAPLVVSVCQNAAPGVRRVSRGSLRDLLIKFDVSESTLTLVNTESDSPGQEIYYIRVKNSRSIPMRISEGVPNELDASFQGWRAFSEHIEERDVRGAHGEVVGKDHWGVWKDSERWRLVVFAGREEVGYPPTLAKEADLFDQVINSACFSTAPSH